MLSVLVDLPFTRKLEILPMPNPDRLSRRARMAGGQPISYLLREALARPELISLAAGFVDPESLPVEPVKKAAEALLSEKNAAQVALQYGTTPGLPALREAVLEKLLRSDENAQRITVDRVILTAGSNQLLHLVGDTLLDPGDIVLCAAPSYFVYLGTLSNFGADVVGVETDPGGLIPESLDEEFARQEAAGDLPRVKLVYINTYHDNPTSVTLSLDRRKKIIETVRRWSRRGKIYVIEDSAYRELRYEGDDIPSLWSCDSDGSFVVYAGTFSKSFSPGIRVGWGVLPEELVEPVCNQKGNLDFGSPTLNQHLMAKVIELGLFDEHMGTIRRAYRAKLKAMLEAMEKHLSPIQGASWLRARGGLYVWLILPDSIDTGATGRLFSEALDEGVLYVPGEHCYPPRGQPVKKSRIRLSFGVQPPDRIREGIASLARAIHRVT